MRGYSGTIGDRVNLERIEHISASKRLQSARLSGSAYEKSRSRPPELSGRCLSAYEFWGIFGVFWGKNGRYPPSIFLKVIFLVREKRPFLWLLYKFQQICSLI